MCNWNASLQSNIRIFEGDMAVPQIKIKTKLAPSYK